MEEKITRQELHKSLYREDHKLDILDSFLYLLLLFIFIFIILITPVHASELKSYEITTGVKNTTNCGTASLGYYCWGQGSSLTTWTKTSFNSTNGYAVNDLAFDLNGTITYQNVPTTISSIFKRITRRINLNSCGNVLISNSTI